MPRPPLLRSGPAGRRMWKAGPLREFALDLDLPAVFLDDAVHDGEPKPGAIILRREKWIEDVRNVFAV